jgi:hypothetical protein
VCRLIARYSSLELAGSVHTVSLGSEALSVAKLREKVSYQLPYHSNKDTNNYLNNDLAHLDSRKFCDVPVLAGIKLFKEKTICRHRKRASSDFFDIGGAVTYKDYRIQTEESARRLAGFVF